MKRIAILLNVLMALNLLLTACATPTPQIVEKEVTRIATEEVTRVVEKEAPKQPAQAQPLCEISRAQLEHGYATLECDNNVYHLWFRVTNNGPSPVYDVEVDLNDMTGLPPKAKKYKLSANGSPNGWSSDAVFDGFEKPSSPCSDTVSAVDPENTSVSGPITKLRFHTEDENKAIASGRDMGHFGVLINPDNTRVMTFTFKIECTNWDHKILGTSPPYTLPHSVSSP
jgi:hypothetical protein